MKRILLLMAIFLLFMLSISETMMGMPAFARKYRMSCATCHEPFPRLKPYGEEFAANGFVLKDQEAARYFVDTGDDQLSLIRDLPLAIRLDGFFNINNSNRELTDFAAPYNIKLLSGGTLAKNISYYFYFFFSERGKVVGLEDAFIMFSDIFHTGISFTAGQFQISDPLFKRELRLTFEDYHIYKVKVGASQHNLTYDRGIVLNYTIPKGPDLVFEVLNGTGIEEADVFKNFDQDKYKNIFGKIAQDIGEHVTLGVSGFYGKEEPGEMVNTTWMLGGDATIVFPAIEFRFQYLERNDDNPFFRQIFPLEIRTRGGFAEMVYSPGGSKGRWYGVGLFNWVDSELESLDYQALAVHFGYMMRRNIRLVTELNYVFRGNEGKHARFLLGLIAAF